MSGLANLQFVEALIAESAQRATEGGKVTFWVRDGRLTCKIYDPWFELEGPEVDLNEALLLELQSYLDGRGKLDDNSRDAVESLVAALNELLDPRR